MAWFDLGDSVTQAAKRESRLQLKENIAFLHAAGHDVSVRVSTAALEADIESAVWPALTCVTLSKTESPTQVRLAVNLLDGLEAERAVRPGTVTLDLAIETPAAVHSVYGLATANDRVASLCAGDGLTLAVHLGPVVPESAALAY